MPITANIILPALSALGSNKLYATSGDTNTQLRLPYLMVSGMSYYHSAGAFVITERLRMAGTVLMGGVLRGDLTLMRVTMQGGSGAGGEYTLEPVTMASAGTVMTWGTAAYILQYVQMAASGIAGVVSTGAFIVPNVTMEMRIGSHGALLLPEAITQGYISTMETSTGNFILPLVQMAGNVSVFSAPGAGVFVLLPVVAGPYGIARWVLPMVVVSGGQLLVSTDFEGWLMNVRNKGVTRLPIFPFTQFATVGNKTYAIGSGGLYLLGGDTDAGAPIVWQFETGLSDFGRPGIKHLPYLYLDGIIDGVIEIVLIDDRGREFAYHYDTKQRGAVHLRHRRKLGNGIRTTNAAFRIKSDTGAYMELDALEPEVTVTQRSI